ncbi:Trm112 family protein [Sphingomonas sp. DT-204]|uniref:Trm112 family protein n=1 Tax=Sphingomonas sp. DT-204 TaxID=3396166 RepID=UPI003F1BFCBC
MTIGPWLLERLVCPATRTPLRWDEAAGELVSDAAGLAYPVRDGTPVLLVERARMTTEPGGTALLRPEGRS